MNNLKEIVLLLSDQGFEWKEKETNIDLFQYNFYMRFFDLTDIDEESFKGGKYVSLQIDNSQMFVYLSETYDYLKNKYNSYIGKSYFVKLLPQRYPSRQYYEIEEYESIVNRCYIPIIVNDKNSFCVNNDVISPNIGEEIFVENDSLVAIYNFGESDIIYLSVDLIPIQQFPQA